jgi:hypothetical protein
MKDHGCGDDGDDGGGNGGNSEKEDIVVRVAVVFTCPLPSWPSQPSQLPVVVVRVIAAVGCSEEVSGLVEVVMLHLCGEWTAMCTYQGLHASKHGGGLPS